MGNRTSDRSSVLKVNILTAMLSTGEKEEEEDKNNKRVKKYTWKCAIHLISVPVRSSYEGTNQQQLHHKYTTVLISNIIMSCFDFNFKQIFDI